MDRIEEALAFLAFARNDTPTRNAIRLLEQEQRDRTEVAKRLAEHWQERADTMEARESATGEECPGCGRTIELCCRHCGGYMPARPCPSCGSHGNSPPESHPAPPPEAWAICDTCEWPRGTHDDMHHPFVARVLATTPEAG